MPHTHLIQLLENQKLKMFATKDSLEEARKAADQLLQGTSRNEAMTALFIYHNTLLLEVQRMIRKYGEDSNVFVPPAADQ